MSIENNPNMNFIDTPLFGDSFLEEHAGNLIQNPSMAIIELIANSLDAGADLIEIIWPENYGELLSITDNGIGMTDDDFCYRWMQLNYNRLAEQGDKVVFPEGNRQSRRKAFGRNGKGRYSMFCFSNSYEIATWRDGIENLYRVQRVYKDRKTPFVIDRINQRQRDGHGTRLYSTLNNNVPMIPLQTIKEIIWSKFVADPSVDILINDEKVNLLDFGPQMEIEVVKVKEGEVPIYFIEGDMPGRTSLQNGITWWVNGRSVGELSWKRMSEPGLFIDRRTSEGKRFTFIVIADLLQQYVSYDWTKFNTNNSTVREVLNIVEEYIEGWLRRLTINTRKEQKIQALELNRKKLELLPETAQEYVGSFIDLVQDKIPAIGQDMLSNAVSVVCNLEEARSGRELLSALAKLDPSELDMLNDILQKWSVRDAKVVLEELQWRLNLIKQLERLVDDPTTDELHQLQPLFENGLWIFGPEYDTKEYTSNRSLSVIVRDFLQSDATGKISSEMQRRRPDFVVLPDRTIGIYSRDGYEPETGDVIGIDKVLILELKRGGFEITMKEIRQAQDYAMAIRDSGKVVDGAKIIGFVLGTKVAHNATKAGLGENEIVIYPNPYAAVLRQAQARTFSLLEKIRKIRDDISYDSEVLSVLSTPSQPSLTEDFLNNK